MPFQHILPPLLAANFTEIAIALVVLFFTVIKALMEANKPANAKRLGGPAVPPPQPQPPRPQPAGGQQADQLRSQVEEFLRRAGRPPQPAQPPANPINLQVGERPTTNAPRPGEAPRPTESRPATIGRTAIPAEKPRSGRRSKRRQTVAEHVAEVVTARSQSLAQKSARLGQRIVAEDQEFDEKLKAKFDHALGTLGPRVAETPATTETPSPPTPAGQIAALLASPDGIRQAVLLNEILRRPSERW